MSCEGAVSSLVKLLKDSEPSVAVAALKAVACAAVHPGVRGEMREAGDCLPVIRRIEAGGDEFMAKHAKRAAEAVLWEP